MKSTVSSYQRTIPVDGLDLTQMPANLADHNVQTRGEGRGAERRQRLRARLRRLRRDRLHGRRPQAHRRPRNQVIIINTQIDLQSCALSSCCHKILWSRVYNYVFQFFWLILLERENNEFNGQC